MMWIPRSSLVSSSNAAEVHYAEVLNINGETSTAMVRTIAEAAKGEYTLIYSNGDVLKLGLHAIERMLQIAEDSGAVMCYADR